MENASNFFELILYADDSTLLCSFDSQKYSRNKYEWHKYLTGKDKSIVES